MMESASAAIAHRRLGIKLPIASHRASHDRHFICISRAHRDKEDAARICPIWDSVSKTTAAILAASLAFSSPEMPYVWTVAHAEGYQSPGEERLAAIERRKELLKAAKERAMREASSEKVNGDALTDEVQKPVEKSRLELLTESVKKQQEKYDEAISKSQTALPRPSREKGFSFPSLPKFSAPDLPKPKVPDMPKFSAPSLPKFSAPDLPKPKVPDMPKFSAPSLPKFSVPDLPKPKVPDMPKSLPKFSAPDLPKPMVPDMPKFSAPSLPKFSAPDLPKFSVPSLPKFSMPDATKPQVPLDRNKPESSVPEQQPASPRPASPFKSPELPSYSDFMKKNETKDSVPSKTDADREPQAPQIQPPKPSPPSSDSVLDLMRKKYSTESPRTMPIPQPSQQPSGAEQSRIPLLSPAKPLPVPSDELRRDAQRLAKEKTKIPSKKMKRKGPLPLWLAQMLLLAVFGGCIYSITVLYSTTNRILTGAYNAADRFLLGLEFSYDRTGKKKNSGS